MKPKILVFIPAYRCEQQISRVIKQFDARVQAWVDTVMVIDNRSPDGTLEAAIKQGQSSLKRCNFIAWRNDDNYGLGGSHKAALRYVVEQNFDYLVVLHGDDQANIHDLIDLFESAEHPHFDSLLGARFMSDSRLQGYSWFRTFGNYVYNALFSLVTRTMIHDLGSGLNLYRVAAYQDFYYKTFPDDLTFNYVMLLASYQRKQIVRFFPISWREEDQRSNVKLFQQAFKVLRLLAGYALQRDNFLAKDLRSQTFTAYTGKIMHQQKPATQESDHE